MGKALHSCGNACRLSRPVRAARHALSVQFLLRAKCAHNRQQPPHHHRSIFFLPPWKNWPPLSVIVQQREGENLNYQGQVLPFLMPFYNGKNSHSVFATARIAPQHTEKDRFLWPRRNPRCKTKAASNVNQQTTTTHTKDKERFC